MLIRFAAIAVACLFIATLLAQFASAHFMFDNLSNFRPQFAAGFLFLAVALAFSGSARLSLASCIGLALNLAPVLPWYLPGKEASRFGDGARFELLFANVYLRNRDYDRLARLIDAIRPDVVGLVEVNSQWLDGIPALRRDYPYRFEAPHEAYVGLALYSKLPLAGSRTVQFGPTATPAIVSNLLTPSGEIELILAHPLPPMDGALTERRDAQLRAMAEYVRSAERPVLLAGDLNSTMWNRNYRAFAERAGLRNARAGHGAAPTWPPIRALGLPLDHITATGPIQLADFRVHGSIGSDHLPISARIALPHGINSRNSGVAAERAPVK